MPMRDFGHLAICEEPKSIVESASEELLILENSAMNFQGPRRLESNSLLDRGRDCRFAARSPIDPSIQSRSDEGHCLTLTGRSRRGILARKRTFRVTENHDP